MKQRDDRRSRDGADVAMSALSSLQQQVRDTQRQLRQLHRHINEDGDQQQQHGSGESGTTRDRRFSGPSATDASSRTSSGVRRQHPHDAVCRLKSLDSRVQALLQQLAELQQRRPIDIQLTEAMFREQRHITEVSNPRTV
jgi:hypothetical protein